MSSLKPMLLTSMKTYSREQFVKDVTAGIIVAIIALPLSIATVSYTHLVIYFLC